MCVLFLHSPGMRTGLERRAAVSLGLRAPQKPTAPGSQGQPSPPPSLPPPSLPFPLTNDVVRGLLDYTISLAGERHWVMIPVVCKVQREGGRGGGGEREREGGGREGVTSL